MTIRVVIIDDHRVVREQLMELLNRSDDVDVVGEAPDGTSALGLAEELRPDVAIVDIAIGGMDGLELTRRLCSEQPGLEVVALSAPSDASSIRRALESGASAYLPKECANEEVVTAVRAVARGDAYLSPSTTRTVVDAFLMCDAASGQQDIEGLTDRDIQILRALADGHTAAAIASSLGLSVKTIEAHRRKIMDRLGVDSTAGLVKHAIRSGLAATD